MPKHKKVKKIAYVTGTRADYGLMTPILHAIKKSSRLKLQIFATGIHLMPEFGNTVRIVEREFPGSVRIRATFPGDTRESMAHFTGAFLSACVKAFSKQRPDLVLTLGDRPEMLCVAVACLYLGIPTAQVHGGEKTSTVDELCRHAITKLSHLHFPATTESGERIRKMGEDAWRIHVVGAPALDAILHTPLPDRKTLFKKLHLDPNQQIILLTQHPVSGELKESWSHMRKTIAAVKSFHLPVVTIYPHADSGGRMIIREIEKEKKKPLFHIFPSLAYTDFLALEREAAVWVGNSSGALIESSSFGTPVVNIGTRQLGRQRGDNVIDVPYDTKKIIAAMKTSLFDAAYRKRLVEAKSPWGDGKTGPRVAKILEELTIDDQLLNKQITY